MSNLGNKTIASLFAEKIDRRIEEVIKVDQADEKIVREELDEYVVTDSIKSHMAEILERYAETPQKPHEGVGIWVSGFFGSGKSSFAKYLGLALENRKLQDEGASAILGRRTGDTRVQVLLGNIAEKIPTTAVIFDVSTDRGIRNGNQSITEIMYRLFLQSLGYPRDLDLAELEITLEEEKRLKTFSDKYREIFNKSWDEGKSLIAIAVQQASRVMHELDKETYPTADSWRASAMKRADVTPDDLAKRGMDLVRRRRDGKTLLFVVDEVGQFVARDVQKMLDLQGVVSKLGAIGRGKMWIVVTSQEKLTELVGGLDDKRVELARLMDRFPLQVHLEPADISEVTSKRVLSKTAESEKLLRELFTLHRGRLTENSRLTADIKLPELTTENFVDLYPLLPYQIDLIIQVVSGLRMQGGASKHVGGANRTIIKLAQQLLIHPQVNLAQSPIGALATADQIYDLVSDNISSEVRGKIADIAKKVEHPLAQPVAKAICLLQYVRSIHRTPENIAASLHPGVDADSRLSEVKAALAALEKALMVRQGDDGYRIPSPAEDDWERQRATLQPKPGDESRIHAEVVESLWQPQPQHSLLDVKIFKAGLNLGGRQIVDGDIPFHLTLAEAGTDFTSSVDEARKRSQTETKSVFWVAALDHGVDNETAEWFRSKEMLSRKERGAQTKDETTLVADEKIRLRRHGDELRRLIKQALLSGTVFFRGNERSPDEGATDVGRAAGKVLSQSLGDVFERFKDAGARVAKKDLDALMSTENLRGLTPVFSELKLLRDQGGRPVFNTEQGPMAEILSRIENRTSYGEAATGRFLTDEFGKEPFGWDFDVVRLLVVALLRSGKIEATSKGQVIDSALTVDAQASFSNNLLFRQASFRPKVGIEFAHLADAAERFKEVFGRELPELEPGAVATALREEVQRHDENMQQVLTILDRHGLPGSDVLRGALNQIRSIRTGRDDQAILNFNGSFKEMKEAIKRGAELAGALTTVRLADIDRARTFLNSRWPFLKDEADLPERDRERAAQLSDLMAKETFFRELPIIEEHTSALERAYLSRHADAVRDRAEVYEAAFKKLKSTPGWEQLGDEQRSRVASSIAVRAVADVGTSQSVPLLRADVHACSGHLGKAIEDMLRLLDGTRVVSVSATSFFSGGIDTEEQLDQALSGLRSECLELIAAGKKVLVK
jgi:Family of unknown function (DUF6079)